MHELLSGLHGTGLDAFLTTIAAGVFWGVWRFANNYWQSGEPFDVPRFASLLAVSMLIGFGNALAGEPLSQASYGAQIAAYTPVVGLLDNIISNALRKYKGGKYDKLYNGFKHMSIDVDGDGTPENTATGYEPEDMQRDLGQLKRQADGWPGMNEEKEN